MGAHLIPGQKLCKLTRLDIRHSLGADGYQGERGTSQNVDGFDG